MTKLLTKLACCSSDDLFVMWSAGGAGEGAETGEIFQSNSAKYFPVCGRHWKFSIELSLVCELQSSCLRGGAEYYEVRQLYPGQQRLNTALR